MHFDSQVFKKSMTSVTFKQIPWLFQAWKTKQKKKKFPWLFQAAGTLPAPLITYLGYPCEFRAEVTQNRVFFWQYVGMKFWFDLATWCIQQYRRKLNYNNNTKKINV